MQSLEELVYAEQSETLLIHKKVVGTHLLPILNFYIKVVVKL